MYCWSNSFWHTKIEVLKHEWLPTNPYKEFFVQTLALTSSMNQKLSEHGKYSAQNNQFPTKTQFEIKDKSHLTPGSSECTVEHCHAGTYFCSTPWYKDKAQVGSKL